MNIEPEEEKYFYFENGLMIMTEAYHLKRGSCCGNKCRHCPMIIKMLKINYIFYRIPNLFSYCKYLIYTFFYIVPKNIPSGILIKQ